MKWLPIVGLICALTACSDAGDPASIGAPIDADAVTAEDATGDELFVTLETPTDGEVLASGTAVVFTARVAASDGVQFPLAVTWGSDRDGELSSREETDDELSFQTSSLSPGPHTMTLWVADGLGRSGQASVSILIDRPPQGDTWVVIEPAEPTSADPLEAQILEAATDPDGQEVTYSFSWFSDGLPVPNAGPLVPHSLTVRGQTWRVIATPSDGLTKGKAGEAEVVIGNGIPSLESAQLLPSIGGTDTTFTCSGHGWSDADGDEEAFSIAWWINGIEVLGAVEASLTGDHFVRGDELHCVLTPTDPYDEGAPVASQVATIIDTPPSVDSALIDPTDGDKLTQFTCSHEGLEDIDEGDEPSVHTLWVVNDEVLPGTTSESFPALGLSSGDSVRCRIEPVSGDVTGSPVDSVEVILGNAPPVGGAVVLEPVPPTEETGVTCVASAADDPDGDNVAYSYIWTVNDLIVPGVDGDFLSGEYYDKGDVIRCDGIPFDGIDQGEPVSAKFSAVAANTAPSLVSVSISPEEGGKTDVFTCEPQGWSDVDPVDEPEYTWAWNLDGLEVPGGIFQTLTPGDIGAGFLTCVATPGDGESWGVSVESAPVLVVNHAPTMNSVTLGPESPTELSTLVCTPAGWNDQDGDPESYLVTWTVNGLEVPDESGLTLTGADFDKTDIVICFAVPFDGADEGQGKASNPVQIQNSPPTVSEVTISPLAGGKMTPFTCTPGESQDPDAADVVLYSTTWYVEDVEVAGETGSTWIPGEMVQALDLVGCTVTPYDGTEFGEPISSGTALITNSVPVVGSVQILPANPTEHDTLTCHADGVEDPDGDPVDLSYTWVLNQSPLVGEMGETLDSAFTEPGDGVRCQVTPSDVNQGQGVWSPEVLVSEAPVELLALEVSVNPPTPQAGEALECVVAYPGGLGALAVQYVWKQNGEVVIGEDGSGLPAGMVQACDVWVCEARVSDGEAFGPWQDAAAFAQTLGGGDGEVSWFGHHAYDPPAQMSYETHDQWLALEVAATRVDLDDDLLPLTVTRLRAVGAQGQGYTVRLYANGGGVPGSELSSASFTGEGPGLMTEIELPLPVEVAQSPVWIGIQGDQDLWSLYGDGDGESTSNMAYTCIAFPGFGCLNTPSWGTISSLGGQFAQIDDLILDLGTDESVGGGCP